MNDVTILYQGGSGGFALMYYLLLSKKYSVGIEYESIDELISSQYPSSLLNSPNNWKITEVWPDNIKCKNTMTGQRLFLICNPCWDEYNLNINLDISRDTYKILLYTDFKLQLRMCYEKRAYWFTDVSKRRFNAPSNNKEYIKNIIKSSVNNLDPKLEQVKALFKPNQLIDLKDFIKYKSIPNFDIPNQQQSDFLDMWYNLQPPKVKWLLK